MRAKVECSVHWWDGKWQRKEKFYEKFHLSVLFFDRAMGARLQTKHKLQLSWSNLSNKLHRKISHFMPRVASLSQKCEVQLDERIEIFYCPNFERNTRWVWSRSFLFGSLAGRDWKIIFFRGARSLGYCRCDFNIDWIFGVVRWKFVVVK